MKAVLKLNGVVQLENKLGNADAFENELKQNKYIKAGWYTSQQCLEMGVLTSNKPTREVEIREARTISQFVFTEVNTLEDLQKRCADNGYALTELNGVYSYTIPAVMQTQYEIPANYEIVSIDDTPEIVAQKSYLLWKAANDYQESFISGMAGGMVTLGVIANKPKALAVARWIDSIWAEYYARKSLVSVVSNDNLDFSSLGPIPYSVPELTIERGAL
jgi:hypothetical protein